MLPAAAAAAAAAIASAATAASAAVTSASTATAASAAILCFINADSAAVELLAVHILNGNLGISRRLEGHETKPPGTPGISIDDDLGLYDGAKLFECVPKTLIGRIPAQATYKNFIGHSLLTFCFAPARAPSRKRAETRRTLAASTIAGAGSHWKN